MHGDIEALLFQVVSLCHRVLDLLSSDAVLDTSRSVPAGMIDQRQLRFTVTEEVVDVLENHN